ncbi:MAG: metallophosphoesterase [Candidatus Altiarchaeota archaeon]
MASIAFIGDCHLGYRHRFKAKRLMDYSKAFEEAVDKALGMKPDAVVFMGDLLHHSKPDPVSLRTVLRKLIQVAGVCPVVVCIGNHEIEGHLGTTYSPIYGDVDENIHVLTSENPHLALNISGKTYGFHGFEFTRGREQAQEKLRKITSEANAQVNILCLHQAVERYLTPHEIPLSLLREVAPIYNLIVSGHVHKHQPIREVSDVTPAFYCGSTERISFNEASNHNGFLWVEKDDFARPKFIAVDSAPMSYVRENFNGTPAEINKLVEDIVKANPSPLLKVELTSEIKGDMMDIRRDWSVFEEGRTVLEVTVQPIEDDSQLQLERVELSEDLIREYFQKSGTKNKELEDLCVELYRRYAS